MQEELGEVERLLEAGAVRVTVERAAITSIGGPLEIIEPNQSGLLVPPGNPQTLAEAFATLITHPEERTRIGMNGYERVKLFFDIKKTVALTVAVYQEIL